MSAARRADYLMLMPTSLIIALLPLPPTPSIMPLIVYALFH